MTGNYVRRNEVAVYRRRNAFAVFVFMIIFIAGLFLGRNFLFRREGSVQTIVPAPAAETVQDKQNEPVSAAEQPRAEDYEVDDSMIAWGDAYSTVFRQNGSRELRTGIDNEAYDYAICPNRQELVLDVSDVKGYLKGDFVLSSFNKSDPYFWDIEIEICDVGNNDPFFTAVMDSDTREPINLSVKLAGHSKIAVRFGYAGGDVYLVTNGLYISEDR